MTATTATLPPPLVKATKHPIRWARLKIELLGAGAVLTHIGTLIIVALYYLLFEVIPVMTHAWHNVPPDWRHTARGAFEGLLGGSLAQVIIWNHFKVKPKAQHFIDRLEIWLHLPNIKCAKRLSPWQILLAPAVIILYALPGFAIAKLGVDWVHHAGTHAHHVAATIHVHAPSYWHKVRTVWTSEWPSKLVGLFSSVFLGRRPVAKLADDIQLWFVERRLRLAKPLRFYHPPTFKARYNATRMNWSHKQIEHGRLQTGLMLGGLTLGLALAGFGYYVLTVIAK